MKNQRLLIISCAGLFLIAACVLIAGGVFVWQGATGNGLMGFLFSSTGGSIAGVVKDKSGDPLENIFDEETIIVALYCKDEKADIDCLRSGFTDLDLDELFEAVCDKGDTSGDCLVHLDEGAALVDEDGGYRLDNVPAGDYGLVFMLKTPGMMQTRYIPNAVSVELGETTLYDILTDLKRK